MAVLDKITEKFNQTTGVVKLNGMIADEEKQINSYLLKIGKICYEKHSDSPNPAIAEIVTQINDAKSRVEGYAEQIKKLKGYAVCSECGGEVPPGNQFCSVCGAKVEIAQPTKIAQGNDGRNCEGCGAFIPGSMDFCSNCGAKVENPQLPNNQEGEGNACTGCGADLVEGMAFCTGCGKKIEE